MAAEPSARAVALGLLAAVLDRRQPLDDALAADRDLTSLEPRDRAFARLLVATALRRLGQLDALIDACLKHPLDVQRPTARHILRLGAVQLLFLATPAHAAVDGAVTLADSGGARGLKGLINAVLRRLAREGAVMVAAQDAARLNLPGWLWDSWTASYGEATTRAIVAVLMQDPPLDLTVRRDPEAWAAMLDARVLATGSLRRVAGGEVERLPGYQDGAWWVQDVAAALPARLLGDVAGRRVADLCAAPGGKTLQLAAAGARVVAVDRAAPRLERVRANLARLKLDAEIVVADAASWQASEPCDAILLDAPCSATGAARRHPDVLHLKSAADVVRLAALQDRLLDNAVRQLRPSGTLVYCTCSLEAAEGPARVARLLASGAPVRRHPVDSAELAGLDALVTPDGELRTLPCHLAEVGGMDGFYAARLTRLE
ncbi:MAG: methyltransferase domain-containing protein [Proteobacteria bacterium]|nr:methyltransferase domain-containing protein [Pseudomonadota bacterium]